MYNEHFHEAAKRVIGGDESIEAAQGLKQVIDEDYPGDERFDDLLAALARYTPDAAPDVEPAVLRTAVREALEAETPDLAADGA